MQGHKEQQRVTWQQHQLLWQQKQQHHQQQNMIRQKYQLYNHMPLGSEQPAKNMFSPPWLYDHNVVTDMITNYYQLSSFKFVGTVASMPQRRLKWFIGFNSRLGMMPTRRKSPFAARILQTHSGFPTSRANASQVMAGRAPQRLKQAC